MKNLIHNRNWWKNFLKNRQSLKEFKVPVGSRGKFSGGIWSTNKSSNTAWKLCTCPSLNPFEKLFYVDLQQDGHPHTHSGRFLTKEVFWLLFIQEENYFDQSITIRRLLHSMLANQCLTKGHILSVTSNQLLWKGICSCTVSWQSI